MTDRRRNKQHVWHRRQLLHGRRNKTSKPEVLYIAATTEEKLICTERKWTTAKGEITSKIKHAIKHTIKLKIIAATTSSCNKT